MPELRDGVSDLPDGPRPQDLREPGRLRVEPVHEAFHEREVLLPRHLDRPPGSIGVERERLLAEDVLSGLQRLRRPLDVHGVGERHVDRVDLRTLEKGCVVVEDLGVGDELAHRYTLLAAPGGDRRHLYPFGAFGRRDDAAEGDPGRPQDP